MNQIMYQTTYIAFKIIFWMEAKVTQCQIILFWIIIIEDFFQSDTEQMNQIMCLTTYLKLSIRVNYNNFQAIRKVKLINCNKANW